MQNELEGMRGGCKLGHFSIIFYCAIFNGFLKFKIWISLKLFLKSILIKKNQKIVQKSKNYSKSQKLFKKF